MAAFKNESNGKWYTMFRYTDWKGERKQKCKRGFSTKREALDWEQELLMQKRADLEMTFESFVKIYRERKCATSLQRTLSSGKMK